MKSAVFLNAQSHISTGTTNDKNWSIYWH